jgi:hypothetical protein
MVITQITTAADEWWYVIQVGDSQHARARVAAWALTNEGSVIGLVPGDDGQLGPLDPADRGQKVWLEHAGDAYCTCGAIPEIDTQDPYWCRRCAGVIDTG